MSTPPSPEPVSRVIHDEGQRLLRVTREHAISEDWLMENQPDLYAQWLAATSATTRDEIAATIDRRFDAIEFPTTQPEPPLRSPTPSRGLRADDQLLELIEDYEARLIGTGRTRDSLPEFRSHIQAHIGWNQLEQSPITDAWHLRDWAEPFAPALLTAWQRDVLSYGDLAGGDKRMASIAAAQQSSRTGIGDAKSEQSPGWTARNPAANHTNTPHNGAGRMRAIEAAPPPPPRAVSATRSETTRARAAQPRSATTPQGRPALHDTAPFRTPRR